ncbi:hypothetical protein MJO28_004683 [Puccinia striiformis f. sp. tritici]|uniref:Uncharacterized protein n=1 Tax=Puccinia striiformis f. sp. tritici TaxID=168172 RepID=A0ACC0EPG1_9BASI|nr:uncharacterized protein Pst134EA_031887 [Puccinia striiformis f. sp. tritici]KAH9444454.1 hypothetical protein Pst134EA_031887 [Puccinia striiformis f. sp. tritici]KAH9459664.1 hypothetical protein Pst134EB_007894 [Puccinia striiformis f. sp. tritici]KAI7957588.1 hypothetical protein MJO28_004683 [Puccinia striiformis f. sp. tritici]KAI9616657.1 hypothetical protein KEM48_005167 [Puccinia striiformis f. sp. tritici PST-130]
MAVQPIFKLYFDSLKAKSPAIVQRRPLATNAMKLSTSVTVLLFSITGRVYGSEFDDWCGLHFGYVKKPWALCGRAKYFNDDPTQELTNWELQPQTYCQPVSIDPNAIPFCCSKWTHDQVKKKSDSVDTIDAGRVDIECHRLA